MLFSLKKTIDKLERDEQRFRTVLDCYLAALHGIDEHAVDVAPELTGDYRTSLRALHRQVSDSPGIEELTQSRTALIHALEEYRSKATACLAKKEEDLRAMLFSLAEAAETLGGFNDRHSGRLKTFTEQLQIVGRGIDLSQMRRELKERVAEFKIAQGEMSLDNSSLVTSMNKQLAEFQKRLERTERRAFKDPLTGLLNRGEGEARLVGQLEKGTPVSVILVDLDDFKQINDRYGHVAGDQVLKTFGHILAHNVRVSDSVCRWGGDEFLIILPGEEPIAVQRALILREQLSTRCKLLILNNIYDVGVSASLGVAQALPGEMVADLIARADMDLYRQKNARKGGEHAQEPRSEMNPAAQLLA